MLLSNLSNRPSAHASGPSTGQSQSSEARLQRDAARIDIREFGRLLNKFENSPDAQTLELIGVCLGTITTKYTQFQESIKRADDLLRKTLQENKLPGHKDQLEAVLTSAISIRMTKHSDGIVPVNDAERALLKIDSSVTEQNFHTHVEKLSKEFAASGAQRILKGVEASALYYAVGKKFCEDEKYQNLVEKVTLDGLKKGEAHGFYGLGHLERTIKTEDLISFLGNPKTPTFIAVELLHWASSEQFTAIKDQDPKFGTKNIESVFNALYNKKVAPLAPGFELVEGRMFQGAPVVGIRNRELKKYGIAVTEHKFSFNEIQELGEKLHLTSEKIQALQKLGVTTHTVKSAMTGRKIPEHIVKALHERYSAMNRYGTEEDSGKLEETGGSERDISSRMGGTVVYLRVGKGGDAAYASMYPARADINMAKLEGPYKGTNVIDAGNQEYFAEAIERVNWDKLGNILGTRMSPSRPISVDNILHLTDYAVGPEGEATLEGKGVARTALYKLMTNLESNQNLMGSIDHTKPEKGEMDHRTSIIAALSTGRVIYGNSRTSHDGNHKGLLTAYSPGFVVDFSPNDQVIYQCTKGKKINLDGLVKGIVGGLKDPEYNDKVVAFDKNRNAFVMTTLKSKEDVVRVPNFGEELNR